MDEEKLLYRDEFREAVFTRDHHRCVWCGEPAVDAHHIIERRLWPDGGYYLDNGVSLCEKHHLQAEQTVIEVEDLRAAAGIRTIHVPPHLYADTRIDKWGNPVLADDTRLPGELFDDASVQKALKEGDKLCWFRHWVKYPRTHHVPWSENVHFDDRIIPNMHGFYGKRVIVTEKMDGENTSMYSDYFHARSVDGRTHPSRSWAKALWGQIQGDIPWGWRVCGENLYAEHSIAYDSLPTYFMGFSIWNEKNICLSWDDTLEWFELLGVTPVPILYDGLYDEKVIKGLWNAAKREKSEGYVIRVADALHYRNFKDDFAKFVRKNHVQNQKHWMFGQPTFRTNKLAKS